MARLSRISVLFAIGFAVLALAPALALYFVTERGITFPHSPPRVSALKNVTEATDLEKLRKECLWLAKDSDRFSQYISSNTRTFEQVLFNGLATLLLWSGLSIAAFLYIAFEARKLSTRDVSNGR